jgi:hypothetical protein
MEKYKSRYLTVKKIMGGSAVPISPFLTTPVYSPIIVGQIYYFQRGVPVENTVEFVVRVLTSAQSTTLLKGLDQEYTQGGFQLPHNDFSKNLMLTNPIAQYHGARQLVFVVNKGVILGLRHRDNIINWDSSEINELLNICNNEINRMYIPIIPVYPLTNTVVLSSPTLSDSSIDEFDNINFSRYKHYKIKFNKTIDIKHKDKLIQKVIKKANNKSLLRYLEESDSPNGGFYLPMTRSWLKYAKDLSIREVFFIIKNDKITGLRFAEDISLWTNDEVDKLLEVIYSIARKLK